MEITEFAKENGLKLITTTKDLIKYDVMLTYNGIDSAFKLRDFDLNGTINSYANTLRGSSLIYIDGSKKTTFEMPEALTHTIQVKPADNEQGWEVVDRELGIGDASYVNKELTKYFKSGDYRLHYSPLNRFVISDFKIRRGNCVYEYYKNNETFYIKTQSDLDKFIKKHKEDERIKDWFDFNMNGAKVNFSDLGCEIKTKFSDEVLNFTKPEKKLNTHGVEKEDKLHFLTHAFCNNCDCDSDCVNCCYDDDAQFTAFIKETFLPDFLEINRGESVEELTKAIYKSLQREEKLEKENNELKEKIKYDESLFSLANKRLKEDVKEREAKIEILNNSCAFNIEEIKTLENKLSNLTGIAKKFKDRVSPEEFFLNEGDFMSNTLSKKVEEYIKHITK